MNRAFLLIITILIITFLSCGCFNSGLYYQYNGVLADIELYLNSTVINCSEENFNSLIDNLLDLKYIISEKRLNDFRFEYKLKEKARFCGIVKINETLIEIRSGYRRDKTLITRHDDDENLPYSNKYKDDLKKIKNYNEKIYSHFIQIYNVHIFNETYNRYHNFVYAD